MILVIVKRNHLVLCYISYICSYIRSDRGSGSNLMDELTDDDDDDDDDSCSHYGEDAGDNTTE